MQANQNPEQIARDRIDAQLRAAGWAVQDKSAIDFNEGEGQAVREYTTDCGPADYVLFLDRKPVGITEAKRETLGQNITRFTDQRDPKPRSGEVFSFHRPETLRELLSQEKSLRARLMELPALIPIDLRECQVDAVTELDGSVKKAKPRSLVQMATGSGKTFTSLTIFYQQPQRRQEVTLDQIKSVLAALKQDAPRLAPLRVWEAYARLDALPENAQPPTELTALVALIRRACGIDAALTPIDTTVRRNYRDWILKKNAGQPFNESQTAFLQLIRDHLMTSLRFERYDLDFAPFAPFDAQGGLGKSAMAWMS